LDKGDGDSVQFISYLIAAFQKFEASISRTLLPVLQSTQRPPIKSIMISLIKEVSDIPNDLMLILDDYHLIDTEEIHKIVELLLDFLPAHIHLVITTRVDPPLPLARLRVSNQLTELRATDLCFTMDETTLFYNKMKLDLSSRDISILESRTEGWIAGLQLTALSMQGVEDIPAFIKTFAGDDRHIADYLTEEVLNQQSEKIQKFLLQTSILNRLSAPLCDFITKEKDSQKILDHMDKTNLFIVPLDNKRHLYRYHHLFANLLQQRLYQTQLEHASILHRRACEWCKDNGFVDEAIEHALCGKDFERAVNLLEEYADALWQRGEHTKLQRWIEGLPTDMVLSKPYLCIFKAWNYFNSGQLDAAEHVLQTAEQVLDHSLTETKSHTREHLICSDRMKIQGRAATIRALMSSSAEDVTGIIQYAHQALENLPKQDLFWRSSAALILSDAHLIKGDITAAYQASLEAAATCKITGDTYFIILANIKIAITLRALGRLRETIEVCQKQMQIAKESGLEQIDIVGWLLAIWGDVLVELNDLDGALFYLKKSEKLTRNRGFFESYKLEILVWSNICLIRALFSKGDFTSAEEVIQKMKNMACEFDVPVWLVQRITFWQARIWLTQEKLDEASQSVVELGLDIDDEFKPKHDIDFFFLTDYILLARVKIHQGRFTEAIGLLQYLINLAKTGGRTPEVIEMLMLQALAFRAEGDIARSINLLKRALSLAEPEGYIRIFVDEGPHLADLLEKVLDTKTDVSRAYVKKLLFAFRLHKLVRTDNGLVERLSERELEVLRFIAAGLSNKKITEELFISLSTVKTHISNIYSKLNVHSRTQALIKAKELDIL
jgi:LuxR family maltose regulon positive regulatory protein